MDLALIVFDGVDTATEAFADARERSASTTGWPDEVGLVEHHEDGHLVLRGMFAGHYLDTDETQHASEEGAAEGWRIGSVVGLLLGPPGFAVGSVFGAAIGSQEGEPSEPDAEPTLVADKLRAAMPAPGSGIVIVADASVVDDMLSALNAPDARVTRRTLSTEDVEVVNAAFS